VLVSEHFGRAPYYVVLTIEDGQIASTETRPKAGHHSFVGEQHPLLAPGERHGYDAGSQAKHKTMAEVITDCQALLAGGRVGDFEFEAYTSSPSSPTGTSWAPYATPRRSAQSRIG
jgi:hypothetical protein